MTDSFLAFKNMELSGKLNILNQLLDDFNCDSNKLLIFSQSKKALTIIEHILGEKSIGFLRLDGDVDVK